MGSEMCIRDSSRSMSASTSASIRGIVARDQLRQRPAIDLLHGDEADTAGFLDRIDGGRHVRHRTLSFPLVHCPIELPGQLAGDRRIEIGQHDYRCLAVAFHSGVDAGAASGDTDRVIQLARGRGFHTGQDPGGPFTGQQLAATQRLVQFE